MSIDLSKLTPAPWTHDGHCCIEGPNDENGNGTMTIYDEGGHSPTDADFIALARNAFDVMMRRGWHTRRATSGEWVVYTGPIDRPAGLETTKAMENENFEFFHAMNPFTALVEADRWMSKKEKKDA